jgi:hypothetical protein
MNFNGSGIYPAIRFQSYLHDPTSRRSGLAEWETYFLGFSNCSRAEKMMLDFLFHKSSGPKIRVSLILSIYKKSAYTDIMYSIYYIILFILYINFK